MATVVSIPSILHTALRNVEYTFSIASIGVSPEEKYLRYRLKNVTDNVYLTAWKYYKPVEDGQEITIDFADDLFEILSTPPPPMSGGGLSINTTIIKSIAVEYGERTINVETCEAPVDTTDGTTDSIDVINGIVRPYEAGFSTIGMMLTKRPAHYSVNSDTYDWIYISGAYQVTVSYYSDVFISSQTFITTQVHPSSSVTIIPVGFQNAPSGTRLIRISSLALVTMDNPLGLAFTIHADLCACGDGEVRDLYCQNHQGGVDPLSFECVDSKQANIIKQFITRKYDEGNVNIRTYGQKRVSKNNSFPLITLRRQFEELTYTESQWLDEMVSSSNCWIRETLPNGTNVLIRCNIVDSTPVTYGEDVEIRIQLQYSEEWLFPY